MDTLRDSLGKYHKVHIVRSTSSDSTIGGFVLGLSESLVLLFKFHDFYPEGCSVLRIEQIESVRSDEYERLWEKMLAAEGRFDAVGVSSVPPLDSMDALLKHLCEAQRPAIIEAESLPDEDEDDWTFLIGWIERVEDGTCWMRHFDGLGEWDTELIPMDLDVITQVQIEAPYLETFLRNIPPFLDPEADPPRRSGS